jgi:hypothetical protein
LNNNRANIGRHCEPKAKQSSPSAATPSRKFAWLDMEFRQHPEAGSLDCFAFGSQ